MTEALRTAETRRDDIVAYARSIGITDAFISQLVEAFYARVRSHPALGPIFDEAIGDDWDVHLGKMKDFWASVALNAGRYSGRPVPAHQKLTQVNANHFAVWIGLFEATLRDIAPQAETVDYFMERAERIARSLQLAMFGAQEIVQARREAEK